MVDILIAGTSCKDASRLNPQHAQRLNVVEKAAHTTGGTFHGFARLVAKFGNQCRMVYLENVVSLQDRDPRTGRSNYDGVADVVRSLGFGFVSATFSARDVGLPIARPRLYMAGVRCSDEALAQRSADEALQSICRHARPLPLDSFLLGEDDPLLMMRDWCREGLARHSVQVVMEGEDAWHRQHNKAWQEIPPSVGRLAAARFAENPWFHSLPPRACDLLLLAVCRHHLAHQTPLVIPLNMSLVWEKAGSAEYLPTLVPSGIFWLVGRGRPLLGVEAVRLQGCDPSMLPGLRPESHDSACLMDLAGNAFCVYQFCAWFSPPWPRETLRS